MRVSLGVIEKVNAGIVCGRHHFNGFIQRSGITECQP